MRDARIDSLRAIAILSVVVGHAISVPYGGRPYLAPPFWGAVYAIVAAYNVQLFMFLSGWVASRRTDLRWVGDRALRVLVPYLAWCVVQYALYDRGQGWLSFLRTVAHPSSTNALWFLPAIFLCSAAFAALRRWDTLLIGVAVLFVFWTPPIALFDVAKASTMFPFFVAGHVASRRPWDPRLPALACPLLVAACWTGPGIGLQWGFPAWYAAWARTAAALPAVVVQAPLRLARFGASTSLIAVWFVALGFGRGRAAAAGSARQGAPASPGPVRRAWRWLGLNTLGVYLCHIYFLRLHVGTGTVAIVTTFAAALTCGVALTLLLDRYRWTGRIFLGDWRTRRPERPAGAGPRNPGAAQAG